MICRCFRSRGVDAVYNWKEVTDEDDRDIELRDDGDLDDDDYAIISRVPGPESLETANTADLATLSSLPTVITLLLSSII